MASRSPPPRCRHTGLPRAVPASGSGASVSPLGALPGHLTLPRPPGPHPLGHVLRVSLSPLLLVRAVSAWPAGRPSARTHWGWAGRGPTCQLFPWRGAARGPQGAWGLGALPEPLDVLLGHPDEEHDGVDPGLDQVSGAADPRLQQAVLVLQAAGRRSAEGPARPSSLGVSTGRRAAA